MQDPAKSYLSQVTNDNGTPCYMAPEQFSMRWAAGLAAHTVGAPPGAGCALPRGAAVVGPQSSHASATATSTLLD